MHRILAVMEPSAFQSALLKDMKDEFDITFCCTAEDTVRLLNDTYDCLLLDLFLPGTDGLRLLETVQDKLPPIVLILTKLISSYIMQSVESLGAGYVLRIPCPAQEIRSRLNDMIRKFESPEIVKPRTPARYHLRRLGIQPGCKGYACLISILPHYDPDTRPNLSKSFFLPLAEQDSVSVDAIDNSIRQAIQRAYEKRNDRIWREYFRNTAKCPTNKEFISTLAEYMKYSSDETDINIK